MKRKEFLLSLPLIGILGKAIANPDPQEVRDFNVKILKEKLDEIRKYPLTERETFRLPTGKVKAVKKIGYKKYQLDVEMVMNFSMVLNGVNFQNGGYGIIREHSIVGRGKYGEVLMVPNTIDPKNQIHIHRIILRSSKKKFVVGINELMVISYSAFPA
jgi:hypothetical protein